MVSIRYVIACLLCAGVLLVGASSLPVSAQQNQQDAGAPPTGDPCAGSTGFLALPPWYDGLTEARDGDCEIMSPNDEKVGGISNFIWIIVLNVVEMILRASAYASVAFIIYGGYKYMISAGSPDGMVGARKTILNAVIGLVISLAAVAIVNTVSGSIGA